MNTINKPLIFRLSNSSDTQSLKELKSKQPNIVIYDTIKDQLIDLYKIKNPSISIIEEEYFNQFLAIELDGRTLEEYGAWVYYPWTNRLVHLLDEQEFVLVRTNRNNPKISLIEQQALKNKTVGIIGLSVGQSVALTMAMERVCGKLRIADFDTIELSNLNRIRTSVHNLGLSKAVAVAREIAEIDPYFEIELFTEGLTNANIQEFLGNEHDKLDVLVELCDGLEMKLKSRVAARILHIPVVMETNDRCMVDIERFDLEHDRMILHGLVSEADLVNLDNLSPQEKLGLVLKIVDKNKLSPKMLEAFAQIGKNIRSWPQLASSVTMGGGITTDIVRKILLGEPCNSGRWYFDVDDILNNDSVDFGF